VRHGIRQQVLSRADFERLIRDEMEAVAGPFDVLAVDEGAPALLGARRARRRAIESMLQQLEAAAEFH
jgi:hypothetical protein